MEIDKLPTIYSYEKSSVLYHQIIITYKREFNEIYISVYYHDKCNTNLTFYSS